jgi:16S rRNA (uracil1498-N3)-methyltransferase
LTETERIQVFDGEGKEFLCEIVRIEKRAVNLKIIREIAPKSHESNLDLTLAVALLKGEKFDLVVQKSVRTRRFKNNPARKKRADVKNQGCERRRKTARTLAENRARSRETIRSRSLYEIEAPVNFEDFIKNSRSTDSENFILFSEKAVKDFLKSKQKKADGSNRRGRRMGRRGNRDGACKRFSNRNSKRSNPARGNGGDCSRRRSSKPFRRF